MSTPVDELDRRWETVESGPCELRIAQWPDGRISTFLRNHRERMDNRVVIDRRADVMLYIKPRPVKSTIAILRARSVTHFGC